MVSAVSSVNQYPVNKEVLEVVRRLQSLGVTPSGNLSIDRQRLQTAELQKKQMTLASNSEVNLNRLTGTENDFTSILDVVQHTHQAGEIPQNGLIKATESNIVVGSGISSVADAAKDKLQFEMKGAEQLAQLNRLKLGLIA